LHNVISDISDIMGHTGQAILRAIVAGERDGATLAKLRDRRIKADQALCRFEWSLTSAHMPRNAIVAA